MKHNIKWCTLLSDYIYKNKQKQHLMYSGKFSIEIHLVTNSCTLTAMLSKTQKIAGIECQV